MRALLAIATLAILALAAAPALADHPTNHFSVSVKDLAPEESITIHAGFEGGPLQKDWVFILVGAVISDHAPLQVVLSLHGDDLGEWIWAPAEEAHLATLALPETSRDYVIELTNIGNESLRYAFYFDQSCDCLAKPLPFPGSFAIFNYDFKEGDDVWFSFDAPPGTEYEYEVLTRIGESGEYPMGFAVEARYPADALENGTIRFTATRPTTYFFLVHSLGGPEGAMLVPVVDVAHAKTNADEVATKATPGAPALALIGIALVVARATRRRS